MRLRDRLPAPAATICLACGAPLSGLLERLGSLRCDECRADGSALAPSLVLPEQSAPRPASGVAR